MAVEMLFGLPIAQAVMGIGGLALGGANLVATCTYGNQLKAAARRAEDYNKATIDVANRLEAGMVAQNNVLNEHTMALKSLLPLAPQQQQPQLPMNGCQQQYFNQQQALQNQANAYNQTYALPQQNYGYQPPQNGYAALQQYCQNQAHNSEMAALRSEIRQLANSVNRMPAAPQIVYAPAPPQPQPQMQQQFTPDQLATILAQAGINMNNL